MKRLSSHILATAALLVLSMTTITSCDKEDDIDKAYTDYLCDFVTYMGKQADGTTAFELESRDNESVTTLISGDVDIPNGVSEGNRVLLRYAPAGNSNGNSMRINAYAVNAIISDSLRYTIKPLEHYLQDNSPVKMRSLWRTGNYLNFHGQLEYTGKSRHFYLLLDSTTAKRDTVDCYFVHNVFGDTTYHWRECYASIYVGVMWKRPTCRVMRVHIGDETRCFDNN